jgi:CheY-like chemotaxis protein
LHVVVAEDLFLLRDGLTRLLSAHGFQIAAAVDTAPRLLRALLEHRPDVAVVDVRMPPGFTDDRLRAALEARRQVAGLPVLLLSQFNKWAAGISDTLALGLPNEAVGLGRPIVTVPWPNVALARHPAFGRNISTLRGCGITVILDLEQLPDDDAPAPAEFPWEELRRELARMRAAFADGKPAPA